MTPIHSDDKKEMELQNNLWFAYNNREEKRK